MEEGKGDFSLSHRH